MGEVRRDMAGSLRSRDDRKALTAVDKGIGTAGEGHALQEGIWENELA